MAYLMIQHRAESCRRVKLSFGANFEMPFGRKNPRDLSKPDRTWATSEVDDLDPTGPTGFKDSSSDHFTFARNAADKIPTIPRTIAGINVGSHDGV